MAPRPSGAADVRPSHVHVAHNLSGCGAAPLWGAVPRGPAVERYGRLLVSDWAPLPQFHIIRSAETDEAEQPLALKLNPFQREQAFAKFGAPKHVLQRPDGTLEVHYTRYVEIRNFGI